MPETTDTDAIIREALETVRGQMPQARERVTKAKDELADAQEAFAALEDKERRYALAIGLKLPKAARGAKTAEESPKPKRGRPQKVKAEPPAAETVAQAGAEVRCKRAKTEFSAACGWTGTKAEAGGERMQCPQCEFAVGPISGGVTVIAPEDMDEKQCARALAECRENEKRLDAAIRDANAELVKTIRYRFRVHQREVQLQAERAKVPREG